MMEKVISNFFNFLYSSKFDNNINNFITVSESDNRSETDCIIKTQKIEEAKLFLQCLLYSLY